MNAAYLKDPDAIYRASFAAIEREIDLEDVPDDLHPIVLRLVHACALPDIVGDLKWSGEPGRAAKAALDDGAAIYVDATMVGAGISADVRCTLNNPGVADLSARLQTTRSAAALEFWRDGLGGSVVAIGNAPTALFHLLEMLGEGDCPRPDAFPQRVGRGAGALRSRRPRRTL